MKTFKLMIYMMLVFVISANASVLSTDHTETGYGGNVTIKVHFSEAKENDSLILYQSIGKTLDYNIAGEYFKSITAKFQKGGWFTFNLKVKKANETTTYISIFRMSPQAERKDTSATTSDPLSYSLLEKYFIQQGDKLSIDVKPVEKIENTRSPLGNFKYSFTGKGSLKYYLRYKADSLSYYTESSGLLGSDLMYNPQNFENKKADKLLSIIKKYKRRLSETGYNELLIHCIWGTKAEEALFMHYEIKRKFKDNENNNLRGAILNSYLKANSNNQYNLPLKALLDSYDFAKAELGKQKVIATIKFGLGYRDSVFRLLMKNTHGAIREKLITLFLTTDEKLLTDFDNLVTQAETIVQTPEYLARLRKMSKKASGKQAYNFELPDVTGKIVKLSDFKGKIVFVDFWYTGCGNCLYFYKNELSKAEHQFENDPEVVFLTISIDKEKSFWLNSVKTGKYTSPSIINLYTAGLGIGADVIKYYDIIGYPQPMIIDKEQNIYSHSTILRTADGISKTIVEIKQK